MLRKKLIPRDYQNIIFEYMLENPRCAIWADMGLGKTSSTLLVINALKTAGYLDGPVLIISTLRVAKEAWPSEVSKWEDFKNLTISAIVGNEKERETAIRTKADIYTTNYENIPWLVERGKGRWPFEMIVADESTKLKGYRSRQGTKRAKAIAEVAFRSKRWVNLTGTPSANGIKDLWGQTFFIDQGTRLGRTYSAFTQRWFRPTFNGYGVEPLAHAQAEISDRLKDCCLTLKAADYFDIKKPIVSRVEVTLTGKALTHYKEMEKKLFTELEGGEIEAVNAAARTQKCLQLTNGAAYLEDGSYEVVHDLKLQALDSVVEEHNGRNILVAYNFRSDLDRILKYFPEAVVLDDDPKTVKDWNAGKIPMLVAHAKSAGHGLSLQDGGHVIAFFGVNWNLEEHDQIIDRIGPVRQLQSGYDRPVFVHYIIAKDTLDENVIERLETKRDVQDILMQAMKRKK